jgi:asparagine synthase (glutamine-hydrolysing)
MCGIAGFISKTKQVDFESTLQNMGLAIESRGPDDSGIWYDYSKGIGFAHRRLSILDISPLGHQPMSSISKRYTIVFNGEIYNHLEIRTLLCRNFNDISWKSHSDTETILELFEKYGIFEGSKLLVGMFAIAIYDSIDNSLYLIRDRIGEKPLYFGWQNESFIFASELKSFHKHPDFIKEIDLNSLSLYFKYNYVPSPHSIYKGVNKLKPGSIVKVSLDSYEISNLTYWDFVDVVKESKKIQIKSKKEIDEYSSELEAQLIHTIKDQMISDVPLGAFLSGGIDSSLIVSLMQSISSEPIKTFTIGYNDKDFNEANHAKKIADLLGTDHTELYLTPNDAISIIPQIPFIYDEPFSDSSQIPTFLVSKLAKTKVSVSLSGDAGDELFSGYNRYILVDKYWPLLNFLPLYFRKVISYLLTRISPALYDDINFFLKKITKSKLNLPNSFGDKIHKIANLITSKNQYDLYDKFVSHWNSSDNIVLNKAIDDLSRYEIFSSLSTIERMMAIDTITYLPDDILVKVDRAAMANSLETRVPFLDHRIISLAWKIPVRFKLKSGKTKYILRKILYKYIPENLIERPKMGFGVPISSWLRGPLKDWAESILSEEKIKNAGLLNYEIIKKKWDEHQSGKRNWQYHLWDVLMFQAWYENQKLL